MCSSDLAEIEAECRLEGRAWLDWTVEDGWKPLCAFLDKPVPDHEFPSGNTVGDFDAKRVKVHRSRVARAQRNMLITASVLVAGVVALGSWYVNPDFIQGSVKGIARRLSPTNLQWSSR